ncbi:hypothetical protein AHF37_00079 [Paragonimus kellicotti]|nr:hypothetical protein AHF37_00079 [Paragonimus kellicotti]
MIDVEVKGCLGQYIKAVLKNITDTDAIVSYDPRDGEEHVPLSNVRLPPFPAKDGEEHVPLSNVRLPPFPAK